jgi:general stress protein YciG
MIDAKYVEPAEERPAGAADPEGDDHRQPEETGDRGGARVGERTIGHAQHHATEAGDRAGHREQHDLALRRRDARSAGRDL